MNRISLGFLIWAMVMQISPAAMAGPPLLGDSFEMDAAVFLPPDTVGQPSVASNGSNYLVVWQDRYAFGDIRGARLDLDGKLIDQEAFNISAAAGTQSYPEVVAIGDHYLVVWQDRRSGSPDVYGARISSDGMVLEKVGVPICVDSESQYFPSVGSDGEDAFVAWRDHRGKTMGFIHGAWIQWKEDGRWEIEEVPVGGEDCVSDETCSDFDQSCSETNGYCVSSSGAGQDRPEVTSNGDNFLVSWHDSRTIWNYRDIYAAQVSRNETEISVETNIAVHASYDISFSTAAIATDSEYLIFWQQQNVMGEPAQAKDLYAARIGNGDEGAVVGPATHLGDWPGTQGYPAAAWTGTEAIVTWNDARTWGDDAAPEIYGARIHTNDEDLSVHEEEFPIGSFDLAYEKSNGGLGKSDVASAMGKSLVAWEKPRVLGEGVDSKVVADIYASLVPSGSGSMSDIGEEVLVGSSIERANDQLHPAIAFDGLNYLVVWQDSRTDQDISYDIYGVRIRASDGKILDDPAIAINTRKDDQITPAVAYANGIFLVAWHDGDEGLVRAARVKASDGTVLDPEGVDLVVTDERFQRLPVMASNGSSFAVVWQEGGDIHANGRDIQGARILASETNGIALNALNISTGPRSQRAPALATNGTDYLVAWTDARNWPESGNDIYGARFSGSTGEVLDPEGFVITDAPNNQEEVALAFADTRYWVAWRAWKGAGEWEGHSIRSTAILTSGALATVASPFDVDSHDSAQILPQMTYDGTHLLIGWADNRKQQGKWDRFGKAISLAEGEAGSDFINQDALDLAPDAKNGTFFGEGNGRSLSVVQDNSSGANRVRGSFLTTSFGQTAPTEDAGGSEPEDSAGGDFQDAGGSEPEDINESSEPDLPAAENEDAPESAMDDAGNSESAPPSDSVGASPADPGVQEQREDISSETSGSSGGSSGCAIQASGNAPGNTTLWIPFVLALFVLLRKRYTRA